LSRQSPKASLCEEASAFVFHAFLANPITLVTDIIEKALRKLAGQALRTAKQSLRPLKKIKTTEVNEIDVTHA
jgi:hypothetical protein